MALRGFFLRVLTSLLKFLLGRKEVIEEGFIPLLIKPLLLGLATSFVKKRVPLKVGLGNSISDTLLELVSREGFKRGIGWHYLN